jgi:hexosaminidase
VSGTFGEAIVLPRPAAVAVRDGAFILNATTTLAYPPALAGVGGWLRGVLGPATGCWLPPGEAQWEAPGEAAGPVQLGTGRLGIELAVDPALPAEGYRLVVEPGGIRIAGGDPAGVFYGAQTLRQLLPPDVFRAARAADGPWTVPALTVTDEPRFRWRGCLLDVARHFLPKADVLRFIDLLAMHKLNVLHLHLTDDQGWRLPVPGWPRLTEVGAWRRESMVGASRHGNYDSRPHGGFYTRSDLREIVAYAADRYVTIVPEVDMPGHMRAAIAAYPELGNTGTPLEVWTSWGISPDVLAVSDRSLAFCRDVLDEVCELFPGDYVCVGGDECPTDQWQASGEARDRAARAGLAGPEALQPWFIRQLAEHLAVRGRRLVGWDEILTGGAPEGATIAAWRGHSATADAARAGHDVIACPNTSMYLDYRQGTDPGEPIPVGKLLTIEDVYAFEPVPTQLGAQDAARVIGVQANVWTEHMDSARVVDYLAFPRLCAAAEVAWSGPGRDVADFSGRLRVHKGRLRAYGVEYRHDNGPLPWQTRPDARGWPR